MASKVYLNRSLSYVDINPQYDHATNKCYIIFQLFVGKSPIIESTVPPIKVSKISIVNLICTLKLKSSNNEEKKEIVMKLPTKQDPIQLNISLGSNLTFYKEIKPLELESLFEWRRGGDIALTWIFRGNGLADINGKTRLLELSYDPDSSFVSPNISQNKWDLMLNRCGGLKDKFISEHSISIPENLGHKNSQFLNQILADLTTMMINLNNAKDRIRKASNASDYKAVMGDVKSALDSLKNFSVTTVNARVSCRFKNIYGQRFRWRRKGCFRSDWTAKIHHGASL
jgi:hypothetical protein